MVGGFSSTQVIWLSLWDVICTARILFRKLILWKYLPENSTYIYQVWQKNNSVFGLELLQETMILRENMDNFQSVANWISKSNKINEEVKPQECKDRYLFLSYNDFLYHLGMIGITANKIFSVCFSFV